MNTIARIASRFRLIVLASAIATLAACQSAPSGSTAASNPERPATVAEIEAVAVGNTVNNAMTYNTDGTYLYRGGNPGRYKISNGRICVNFNSGGRRCDRVVNDGGNLVMINRNGQRFPFG